MTNIIVDIVVVVGYVEYKHPSPQIFISTGTWLLFVTVFLRRDNIKQHYLHITNQGNYFQSDPSFISGEEYRIKAFKFGR